MTECPYAMGSEVIAPEYHIRHVDTLKPNSLNLDTALKGGLSYGLVEEVHRERPARQCSDWTLSCAEANGLCRYPRCIREKLGRSTLG